MTIHWGILGTGYIAGKFAKDFKFVSNGKILAVASRGKEKAEKFANEYGVERVYDSYEKLVADKDIQVVYITSPHNVHLENVLLCLKNNKAVLCEKPMAVNVQQLSSMIYLAKKNNLFLMEAMWTYFLPPVVKVLEWIEQGMIGDIVSIKAEFGFKTYVDKNHRLLNPDLAGGALLDIGIYPIAFATLIMKQAPEKIHSEMRIGQTGVDVSNTMLLKYGNGVTAQLSSSLETDLMNDAVVFGTKGYIIIPKFWMAKKAILNRNNETSVEFVNEHPTLGMNYETDEVNQMLLKNKKESPVMSLDTSMILIRIMDEVRKKAKFKYPFE